MSQEAKKGMTAAGKTNVTPLEEKVVDEEPLVFANKQVLILDSYFVQFPFFITEVCIQLSINLQEAKSAFKSLLESANVEADWSWEQVVYSFTLLVIIFLEYDFEFFQTMRVIINDKRYGALKTLGERKQAFNEVYMQYLHLQSISYSFLF